MSTSVVLPDLESLLEPISTDEPAGRSLRYEGTYDRVREARRADDASLPMGEWETKLKTADWGAVERLCLEALRKKSKDLQIAAWLAEAWLVRGRVRGLAHAFALLAGLCERFWDGLYPPSGDEPDTGARAALFAWIDDVLADRLRRTPFADGEAGYTLLDWELAGTAPALREGEGDAGPSAPEPRPTRASLLARITLSGTSPWTALALDAQAALVAVGKLDEVLAVHLPRPPALRRIKDVLGMMCDLARDGIRAAGEDVHAPSGASAARGSVPPGHAGVAAFSGGSGPIGSRAEAYYRLAEAAEYLLRTEPHSPVPYLVKRAVQWGNMSLAELLYEFIGSPDDLVMIQRLLGMRGKD